MIKGCIPRSLKFFGLAAILVAGLSACSDESVTADQGVSEVSGAGSALSEDNTLENPATFPDNKTFTRLDGTPVDPVGLEGKSILVNYWATWCAPCIREIPSLMRAADALGDDFVVMLASDETPEQITAFISENNFHEEAFVKLEGSFASHRIQAVPSTSMFGPDGEQVGQWLGEKEWDHEEIIAGLRSLAQ